MNILIPIDFSNNSLKAAKYALMHYPKAEFTLLNVVHIRQAGATLAININNELRIVYQKKMKDTVQKIKNEFPKASVNGIVEVGLFSETIDEIVKRDNSDLLVLGTNGASRFDELLLGSNAFLAIKNATIPLLIINPSQSLAAPKKLLFASDFEGNLEDKVVKPVIDFKHQFGAEMHVIHINQTGDGSDVNLKINHLIDDEVEHFHIINNDNIENAITDFAEKENFDFVVLAPKYRGIIKGLFHTSVAKKISAMGKTSLFILK